MPLILNRARKKDQAKSGIREILCLLGENNISLKGLLHISQIFYGAFLFHARIFIKLGLYTDLITKNLFFLGCLFQKIDFMIKIVLMYYMAMSNTTSPSMTPKILITYLYNCAV